MASADFEIKLSLQGDTTLRVALRFTGADGTAARDMVEDLTVPIDPAALREASDNMERYGRLLSQLIFRSDQQQRALHAWDRACQAARDSRAQLRVCLRIDPQAELLHSLYWETLFDPTRDSPLGQSTQHLLARYLDPNDLNPLPTRSPDRLRALVVVASPFEASGSSFQPIRVEAEVERMRSALAGISLTVLARPDRQPTLLNLSEALEQLPDIIYIACHGVQHEGESYLLLERPDGTAERVRGSRVAQKIEDMAQRPLLVVLAVCHSGGGSYTDSELEALGPRLVRAGVPAVVAMRGAVPFESIEVFSPVLFRELRRHGQIDRAVAVARTRLADLNQPWWMPTLTMRVRDGTLWTVTSGKDAAGEPGGDAQLQPAGPGRADAAPPGPPEDRNPAARPPASAADARAAGINHYRIAREKIDEALFQTAALRESELRRIADLLDRAARQAQQGDDPELNRHAVLFEQARLGYLRQQYDQAEQLFNEAYFHFAAAGDSDMVRRIEEFQGCIDACRELESLTSQGVRSRERQAQTVLAVLQNTIAVNQSPILGLLLQLLRQMAISPADELTSELLRQSAAAPRRAVAYDPARPDQKSPTGGTQEQPYGRG